MSGLPEMDTAGRFMSTRPKLLDGPPGDYSFPHSADFAGELFALACSSGSRGEALASAPRLRLGLRDGAGSAAGSATPSTNLAFAPASLASIMP